MKNWYKELETRFASFPAHTQIMHFISDLEKAKNLQEKNPGTARNHLLRAIILLDYIINDPKWRSKRRECLRLREVVGSLTTNNAQLASLQQTIQAACSMEKTAYKTLKGILKSEI